MTKTQAGAIQNGKGWRLRVNQPEREGEKDNRPLKGSPDSEQSQKAEGAMRLRHALQAGSRHRPCLLR